MRISFHGAAGEVTGSCSYLELGQENILVDCGMFQGGEKEEQKNFEPFKFNARSLKSVIVTHAHLDHVGRLPLLIGAGFTGPIYCTPATADLTRLILEDALMVMEYNYRKMGKPVLYDLTAIEEIMKRMQPVEYEQKIKIEIQGHQIDFTFHEAGHIFGSAFVEFRIDGKKIVFSGDIGNTDVPVLRNTAVMPNDVELVICESTYGGRVHETKDNEEREKIIRNIVSSAVKRGGVLMIPSFALERTQQLMYILNDLIDRKKALPRLPIFLDSPLAIHATDVYRRYPNYYNPEATRLYKIDNDLFRFKDLIICVSKEESKNINDVKVPKIIIAGSGMLEGGRIIHHARRYLSGSDNTLLFIGYQARNTLGRRILEGESQVKILNDRIPVKCHIEAIGALSAHADSEKLLDWLGGGNVVPSKVYFNHGESDQATAIADLVSSELGIEASLVSEDTTIEF